MISATTPATLAAAFAAGLVVPVLTTPAGISGAVILLPFELVVLRLGGPAVSSTTLLYNVIAMPAGIWRYRRAGRLSWPLAAAIAAGSLPGAVAGVLVRTTVAAGAAVFGTLLGVMLTALALQLAWRAWRAVRIPARPSPPARQESIAAGDEGRPAPVCQATDHDPGVESLPPVRRWPVGAVAFLVGGLSGMFGIGGGSLMSPALVNVQRWPVRAIAGATLVATFATSLAGLAAFTVIGLLASPGTAEVFPYWGIGIALGAGGMIGSQLGPVLQDRMSERALTVLLAVLLLAAGLRSLAGGLRL